MRKRCNLLPKSLPYLNGLQRPFIRKCRQKGWPRVRLCPWRNINRATTTERDDFCRLGVLPPLKPFATLFGSAGHGELRHADISRAAGCFSLVLPATKVPQTAPFTSRTHCPAYLRKPAATWQKSAVQNFSGGESGRPFRLQCLRPTFCYFFLALKAVNTAVCLRCWNHSAHI